MRHLTYDKDRFYLNGEPHTILSGAMHYFRIPREYWRDRLQKLYECGFNTVETYTPWNLHEPREGEFDFEGNLDVAAFIAEAAAVGLDVILRPGPYICAEWEFGGLPAWLLTYGDMALRCNDPLFLSKVERYYDALLPRVRPYLGSAGGPLLMLQVENEYGSYGNDKDYLRAIKAIYERHGMDCLYFTSDGPCYSMMQGGTLDGVLAVANFGSRPRERLGFLKQYRSDQPLMCGEYWCGWFDHWGEEHHFCTVEETAGDLEEFFRMGASFNFYMFHGGTNFGFMNGANYGDRYLPTVTSYDYGAPLSEAGDRTPTYYALRDMVTRYYGAPPALTASETRKAAYGRVRFTEAAPLFENLKALATPVRTPTPRFMEDLGQSYGYILYRTHVKGPLDPRPLTLETFHDKADVYLDGERIASYLRWAPPAEEDKPILGPRAGETLQLDILCENMGRVNYGPHLLDRKGVRGVRLGNFYHFGWETYPLPMTDLSRLSFAPISEGGVRAPAFLRATLTIEGAPADTFLRTCGLKKGFVTVNGKNIGRYYNEAGPTQTLYVPAPFLREGENEILVFETDGIDAPAAELVADPILG